MQIVRTLLLALVVEAAARADFSYTMTRKSSGAMGAAGEQATKYFLKGQKMMTDSGSFAMVIDFDAQTFTAINKTQKTYTVTPFAQMGQGAVPGGADVQADFKETGQHKVINGFNASQALMTMQMEMAQAQGGMKTQMEMEFWVSPDVPGASELRAFYQRNLGKFPWAAMAGGGNPSMQKAMAEMQRRMANMNGVPVLQIVRVKSPGGANSAQTQQMQQGMAQARARLEAMAAQGGPQGDAAKQALARMGGMSAGGGSMFETTMEAGAFSTNAIPDGVFDVPAGFQKTEK